VESRVRRKKSRGVGVFQFAKTVEDGVWKDEESAKSIQEQVSRLAREYSTSISSELKPHATPASLIRQKDDIRRYTILNQHDADADVGQSQAPTQPPKVISHKDLPSHSQNSDIKMFDAVLEPQKPAPPSDPEMDKFLPLLQDYLKIHDVQVGATQYSHSLPVGSGDYVWDVFYHRSLNLREWNEAVNVGTISGLPLAITNPYDSASESEEEEDEADEDSNAEEYYKNDYPEEEDGSDEFHEGSEHDDMERYYEQGSDDD